MLKEDIYTEEIGVAGEVAHSSMSDYEIKRNKPMPNRIRGKIQSKIGAQLEVNYGSKYDIASEVTLDTKPKASTPDISIFPKKELDWETIEAKEKDVPFTTVEIISPTQSFDEMAKKIFGLYFPLGVQSAWIVMPPPFKTICVLTPDNEKKFFDKGTLTDPVTGMKIEVEKVFVGMK